MMIDIEIKGRLGQFIKAQLRNVIDAEAVVIYPDRKEEDIVPLSKVRLSPTPVRDIQPNQSAEVLFSISDTQRTESTNLPGHSGDGRSDKIDHQLLLDEQNDHLSIPSWWPCRVLKVRGEIVVVKLHVVPPLDANPVDESLCSKLSAVTDIVNQATLRQPSGELPPLTPEMIHRHSIPVPKEMAEFASNPEIHTEFLRHCGGQATVYFDNDSSSLVVLSTDLSTVHNVPLLEDTYVKMLRQKWAITRSLAQTMRTLEANRSSDGVPQTSLTTSRGSADWSSEPGSILETFYVPQHLMGLAIGAHGVNIKGAREIPDVLYVRVREGSGGDAVRRNGDSSIDNGTDYRDAALFIVEAKTVEAAKLARSKLEYTELYIGVPRRYVGRLIGKRTNNILFIIKKSGVIHIHFDDHIKGRSDDDDSIPIENLNISGVGSISSSRTMRKIFLKVGGVQPTADEEYGGFILVGTRDSIEKARLLFTFQLDYIWDLEKMEAEKAELIRSLSHTVGTDSNGASGYAGGRGHPDSRWVDVASRRGGSWNRVPPRGGVHRGDDTGPQDDSHPRVPANGITSGEMDGRQLRANNPRPRRTRGGGGGPPRNYGNWNGQQRQSVGSNNNGEVPQRHRASRNSDGDANSIEFSGDQDNIRCLRPEQSADERQFADGEGSDGPHTAGTPRQRTVTRISLSQSDAHEQRSNRYGRPTRQRRTPQYTEPTAPHNDVTRTSGTGPTPYMRQAVAHS